MRWRITEFKDDPSLIHAVIATIAKWVDTGAPIGNTADIHVQHQEVEGTPGETSESGCSVRHVRGLKILPCQEFKQYACQANIVIHDEDSTCGHI